MQPSEYEGTTHWETEVYSRERQVNRWPHTEIVSRLIRVTSGLDRSGVRILELGCGTGNNLRFLAEEGFDSYGIDASPTAVAKARELLHCHGLNARIQTGDMAQLPWPEGYFDLILDRAALVHNAPDRIHGILKEVVRVLKHGGRVLSIGLKSIEHPELQFGQKGKNGAWTDFSHGKFRNLGDMTFCNDFEVQEFFDGFDIESAEKVTRRNLNGEILDEEFIVEAVRR